MEKRCEARYTIGHPVAVTVLSGQQATYQTMVKDASGRGMALEMPVPVGIGAAVKIALEDCFFLGEAVHCSRQGDGFLVGVLLDSRLSQLSSLARTLEAFADGQSRPHAPV